ncbi:hypothetical protein Hdeb2414_s0008g00294231 [Helianthus debilis subsp. tardiflorus]
MKLTHITRNIVRDCSDCLNKVQHGNPRIAFLCKFSNHVLNQTEKLLQIPHSQISLLMFSLRILRLLSKLKQWKLPCGGQIIATHILEAQYIVA